MKTPKQRFTKNVFSSWTATLVTAIIAVFMSPFLVHTLGKEQYGIWALALSIISYTSLLNAGMNQTLSRYAPKYYATKDYDNLNQVVNSIFLIFCISGVLVLIATAFIAYFFIGFFNIESQYLEMARNVMLLVGLNQALTFFYITPSACGPFHRYTITNGMAIARTVVGALLTVYFLKSGYGLLTLAIITVVVTLSKLHVQTMIRNRIVPQIKYSFKYITKQRLIEMLNFGGVSFLIMATYLIIFNTDNIIVGIFKSTAAVTFYSLAGNLVGYLRVIAHSVSIPLTPLVSHMDSSSNFDEIKALYYNLTKKLYYIYGAICVSVIIWGEQFIFLWLGEDFSSTVKVLYILIVPICLCLPQLPAGSILLGLGRHKSLFYMLAIEAVSNIILSLIFVRIWGIYGVALGTAIPQLIIYSVVYPLIFNKIISGDLKLFYSQSLKMLFYGALFALPISLLLMKYNYAVSWFGFIINTVTVMIFIVVGFYIFVLNRVERDKIKSYFNKLTKRIL